MAKHYTYMGDHGIEFMLTTEQVKACSHSGDCEDDVRAVVSEPSVRAQLNQLAPTAIAEALKPYGAWDETDLLDAEMNEIRFVWMAASDIKDAWSDGRDTE